MKRLARFFSALRAVSMSGLLGLALLRCTPDDTSADMVPDSSEAVQAQSFNLLSQSNVLRIVGDEIIDSTGKAIQLKGVGFSNNFWKKSSEIPTDHHGAADYERVKQLGLNSVRFYLDYRWFEDDNQPYIYREEAWKWLDDNVKWARQNDIYLVLNMHSPQGRFQGGGITTDLWTQTENQHRLLALWKAIAARYRDEPVIAGYGPLNEPRPNESVDQWSTLAQHLIDTIRSVDQAHPIFIERAIKVGDQFSEQYENENLNFPVVADDNLVYEFHIYNPIRYTHQLMEFTGLPEGGKYPDPSRLEVSKESWYGASFSDPQLPAGTTDGWTYVEGNLHAIEDESVAYVAPGLTVKGIQGKVYLDSLVVKEYDADGDFVRDVFAVDPKETHRWTFYSENQSGSFQIAPGQGYQDAESLMVEGVTAHGSIASDYRFVPKEDHRYQISGWLKGENIDPEATCSLRLFYYATSEPVMPRDKAYVRYAIERYTRWVATQDKPPYLGEFGTGAPSFNEERGGVQYIEDVLSIAHDQQLHFSFHSYRGTNFGIIPTTSGPSDLTSANQKLVQLFQEEL